MRRLIYGLLVVGVLSLTLCSSRMVNHEIYPSDECMFNTLSIYPNYIIFDKETMTVPEELTFNTNHKVYRYEKDSIDTLGIWIVRSDTLLIYHNWSRYTWFDEEEKKKYGDSEYDARIFFVELHLRKKTDLSFPINVSAFRVLNHGDSLISLNDELNFKGIPISSKAVHDAHYWYDAMSRKNLLYKPTNFQDTLYWHATLNRQNANYTIKDINNTMVRVSKGAIAFNILNPRYYPQSEALPYAQRREYCEWFDRVNVGDTISLELTRPAYEQEVFDRSPYLKGYPDTIYVLDNEAYGYWFAKPIYNNR